MKKILMLVLALLMISIPFPIWAASPEITISDATAVPGQVVYLNIELINCKKANTLAITMEYDSTVLKKVANKCTWEIDGKIQDFDVAKDRGVWCTTKAKDLNGKICTLAFRVKQDISVADTEVSCRIQVKNDSKDIGTYSAKAIIRVEGAIPSQDVKIDNVENPKQEEIFPEQGEIGSQVVEKSNLSKQEETVGQDKQDDYKEESIAIKQEDIPEEKNDEVGHKNKSEEVIYYGIAIAFLGGIFAYYFIRNRRKQK